MKLDPSPEEFRRWGEAALDAAAHYLESLATRRVYPKTTAAEIREKLDRHLPVEPVDFDQLLDAFRNVIVELSRQNAHPRMFGYVQSPGTGVAAIADLLTSVLNANLTAWRSAPAPVELERLTIDWIKQLLGYDKNGGGLFVSGGSMANLAGLAAARGAKFAPESLNEGVHSIGKKMCIYGSRETHHSIEKAATLLGIGRDNFRKIDVDKDYKIRIDQLSARIEGDVAAGHIPICVVANAGTVMTGAVDPLQSVGDVARRFNLWMHVDAAYGGFAAMCPSVRSMFAGIDLADSVALDPHKWLYIPADCGCVLYRDPAAARAAFALDAEYTRVIGQAADEAFAFWDYGPELSRRFRALKVWMVLKGIGVKALGEAVEKNIACARHLQQLVTNSDDFEMLAPVELSIFCFRYVPDDLRRELPGAGEQRRRQIDEELDAFNERLLVALQLDGSSYLSNALINGRFSLRGCVMNYRTSLRDMEILLEDLRRVAGTIGPAQEE
jgi:glutamate/tyrosine decarboxylase-like PLP-dependent enzyme